MRDERILLLAAALCVLALAGCVPAEFDHPLSDPALAVADSSLFGAWIAECSVAGSVHLPESGWGMSPNYPGILCIAPAGGGEVGLVMTSPDSACLATPWLLYGFASRLGQERYLNLHVTTLSRGGERVSSRRAGRWWIVRYELLPGGRLRLAFFDDEKAGKLMGAGRLQAGRKLEKYPHLTTSTAELARLLPSLPPEECFEEYGIFHRLEAVPYSPGR
jgi:hypothetical protein